MRKIKELFDAQASSPSELNSGDVGFRIPEYQREYDWSEKNIERLFCDCLIGFYRLCTSSDTANAFTFLGTLILVQEKTKEEDFFGTSYAIVDGQQRLTTLALLACALYEKLLSQSRTLKTSQLGEDVKKWIHAEIEDRFSDLSDCVAGTQKIRGTRTYPYPRIIRTKDERGRSRQTSEYLSPLGKFLDKFSEYANDPDRFDPPSFGSDGAAKKLGTNYGHIGEELVGNLNNAEWYEDRECDQVSIGLLDRSGCRYLLDRLPVIKGRDHQSRAIAALKKCEEVHDLLRTLLFASYFCRCIVLTRVTTDDESAAFDIFDALNTTGEPLTALETLKPRVIQYEDSIGKFAGSLSDTALSDLQKTLDKQCKDTADKQKETKKLIVSFALYMEGTKLSEHLAAQRSFLRTQYERVAKKSKSPQKARRFVTLLAGMAQFRRYYWTSTGIEELGQFHANDNVGQVQLLMSFILDMRTNLALPVIARYWHTDLKSQGDGEFLEALKATTAFLILRRAASGGTAGIDSDFRAIMAPKNGSTKRFGLYAGIDSENERLSITELKKAMRKLLAASKFKISHKDKWVDQVIGNPLYDRARVIARFMILTAAHQAMPSPENPGCWKKKGVKASPHTNNFLTYDTWKNELYETVEHIAPDSEPADGWDLDIYKDTILRDSLGNLILLPKKVNSAIGNGSWKRKKVFYLALTEKEADQQQERIDDAADLGMKFSDYTTKLLQEGKRLDLLDPLRDVENWDRNLIETRSRNIAELTWDHLWPWLN